MNIACCARVNQGCARANEGSEVGFVFQDTVEDRSIHRQPEIWTLRPLNDLHLLSDDQGGLLPRVREEDCDTDLSALRPHEVHVEFRIIDETSQFFNKYRFYSLLFFSTIVWGASPHNAYEKIKFRVVSCWSV